MWELQRAFKQSGRGFDWRFTSYYDEDSDWGLAQDVQNSANSMTGQMYTAGAPVVDFEISCCCLAPSVFVCNQSQCALVFVQEWWDSSDEAGPKSRPGTQFDEERPPLEVLAFDHEQKILKSLICMQVKKFGNRSWEVTNFLLFPGCDQLRLPEDTANSLGTFKKKLLDQVSEFNEQQSIHMRSAQPQASQPTPPRPSGSRNESSHAASPVRTVCGPAFEDGDCPRNLQKVLEPSIVLSTEAFSIEKTWLGFGRADNLIP